MSKIKSVFYRFYVNRNYLFVLVIILSPILFDLEYLFYPFLYRNNFMPPSYLFINLLIPVVTLLVLIITYFRKKTINKYLLIYIVLLFIFIYFHNKQADNLYEILILPFRFSYNLAIENQYFLVLFMPILLYYIFYSFELDFRKIIFILGALSVILSLIIIISNLTMVGFSTYSSEFTLSNFFSWFNVYPSSIDSRLLTTRFFFKEGNTISAYFLSMYPFVVLLFLNAKGRWIWAAASCVILQSLAMFIIGTRTATFGAILVIVLSFILVYFLEFNIINKKIYLNFLIIIIVFQIVVLPFSPAVKNQVSNFKNNSWVLDDEWIRRNFANQMDDNDLISGSDEYYYYYLNIFEDYKWLLTIPNDYYHIKYSYYFDPKFYVDLIFKTDLLKRQSSRQFQRIFYNYKWKNLSNPQKLLGMGYSRFYSGSILLEQDFLLQFYSFGVIGFLLLIIPYMSFFYYIYKIISKKREFNLFICFSLISILVFLSSAYFSGHVLDRLFITTSMALVMSGFIRYSNITQISKKD